MTIENLRKPITIAIWYSKMQQEQIGHAVHQIKTTKETAKKYRQILAKLKKGYEKKCSDLTERDEQCK